MAAISATVAAPTFGLSSSSPDKTWDSHSHAEFPTDSANGLLRSPLMPQDANSGPYSPTNPLNTSPRKAVTDGSRGAGQASTPLLDLYESDQNGPASDIHKQRVLDTYGVNLDDENSKWIHRDKLARIESEELHAAGIILPRPRENQDRSRSKPRREQSQEKANGFRKATDNDSITGPRSRKNSTATLEHKTSVPSWDLRLPEEVLAEEEDSYFVPQDGSTGSRIPVAKLSPLPLSTDHLDREFPMGRKHDSSPSPDEDLSNPKTRGRSGSMKGLEATSLTTPTPAKRSATDSSPKKVTGSTVRKNSAPPKSNSQTGRPKTRNGPSKDSIGSAAGTTRPKSRSSDRELMSSNKQPEGEPPWMVSAYRPDPRLPPDQQLLPTVARRLQQEKWEKEGKFGNIYDKEFRPLTDEGFAKPPELELKPETETETEAENQEKRPDEWPLRAETKSPTQPQPRAGSSYSTVPRIQEKPIISAQPSPRGPILEQRQETQPQAPEAEEETKGGCGCCVVM